MYTVVMLAAPHRADLTDAAVTTLRSRWDGGHALWLSYGVAAEFPVADMPSDFDAISADWRART